MLPAHERLVAHGAAGVEGDLGLEVEDELALVDRALQLGEHDQPLGAAPVALAAVTRRRAGTGLGLVHRHVGVTQQTLDVVGVHRADRDADAAAYRDAQPLEQEGLVQRAEQGVGDHLGVGRGIDPGEQDAEFVAAEPGDKVFPAHLIGQPLGNLLQQHVTHGVSERVVDLLEPVEIEQQQGDDLTGGALLESGGAAAQQQRAVGQPGQAVVGGLVDLAREQPRVDEMAADGVGERREEVALAFGQRAVWRQRDVEHADGAFADLQDLAGAADQLGRAACAERG